MRDNVILVVFLLVCVAEDFCQAQSCDDVIPTLPGLERRARNKVINGIEENEPYNFDFYLDNGWYRVKTIADGQFYMPDSSSLPEVNTCGTYYPIYLADTHPDTSELTETPVALKTCQRSTFSDCEFEYLTKVRRCNDEIQYYLTATELAAAYCFDPWILHNVTSVSAAPIDVNVGTVSVESELRFREVDISDGSKNMFPYLVFKCKFSSESFFYTIEWYINGGYYRQMGPSVNIADLELPETVLNDDNQTLGLTLKCGVRASVDLTGFTTETAFSSDFFAGIKVLTQPIYLSKTAPLSIMFRPTVPVGCTYNTKTHNWCKLALHMYDPSSGNHECHKSELLTESRHCAEDIQTLTKEDEWNPADATFNMTVKTNDYNFADPLTFYLHLKTYENTGHVLWKGVEVGPIPVIVTESETYKKKICYTRADPHKRTFNQTEYEHQVTGEFQLFKNTRYDIEVQEKTTRCYKHRSKPTCTCAIAVRAGRDVFMINRCGSMNFIGFLSCEDGGILEVVQKETDRYYVYTPTGTWVDILLWPEGTFYKMLNVDITASPKDVRNTRGLCGTFGEANEFVLRNGSTSMDPTPEFMESWRLQNNESLFANGDHRHFTAWTIRNEMYCACEKTNQTINNKVIATYTPLCSKTQYLNCTLQNSVTERKCLLVNNRTKRAFGSLHLETEKMLQLMATPRAEESWEHRQKRQVIITEDMALERCTNVIMGSLVAKQYSDNLFSNDLEAVIGQCVIDAVAGNDVDVANLHVRALNNQVGRLFEQDPDYVANNTDHVQNFHLNTCPNNCSGSGTCNVKGQCECFETYYGSDCSIDAADTIHIDHIDGGSTCDVASGDECRCFYIYTTQLVFGFTCSITITTFDVKWDIISTDHVTETGDWYDMFSGMCCLALNRRDTTDVFTTQLTLAVSNSGSNFGGGYKITSYDSTCQNVTTSAENDTFIELKEGHCFLDGQCFAHGESQLSDTCYRCISSTSTSNWTYVCESSKQPVPEDKDTALIVSTTVGISLLILGAIVVFCAWRKICRKTTKQSPVICDVQGSSQDTVWEEKSVPAEIIFSCVSPLGPSKDHLSLPRGITNLSIYLKEDLNISSDEN